MTLEAMRESVTRSGALRRIQTLKKSPEKDLSQAASRLEASLVPSEKRLSS